MPDPVVIVEYSAQWPSIFAEESRSLRSAFEADAVDIEHVGSTAVPELFEEYRALKLRLAAAHRDDRAAYTDAKAPFIRAMLDRLASRERTSQS